MELNIRDKERKIKRKRIWSHKFWRNTTDGDNGAKLHYYYYERC